MIDMQSIAAAVGSLKTAADITKTMIELKGAADVNAKAIELQSIILSAQSSALAANSEQFTLLQRVRQLEEELAKPKQWETEKQRYELVSLEGDGSVFAYRLKEDAAGTEPSHYICAHWNEERKKSLLQSTKYDSGRAVSLRCPRCEHDFYIHGGP